MCRRERVIVVHTSDGDKESPYRDEAINLAKEHSASAVTVAYRGGKQPDVFKRVAVRSDSTEAVQAAVKRAAAMAFDENSVVMRRGLATASQTQL